MDRLKLLIVGLLLMGVSPAFAFDDGDFQVWNTDTQEFKVNDNSKVTLEEEFRWGDNANHFYYHHYDAGVSYALNRYFSVGGGYRHVLEDKKVGKVTKFRVENEPYVTATLFGDLKGFKLEDRSRLEYRHFDYTADSWRYRNKFTVKGPWKFSKFEIQPYLADEVFFGSSGKSLNQNRISSGFAFNITKNFKAEIYYMLQNTRGKIKWTDANILGTKFKLAF